MLALAPLASATPTHPKPSPRCHGAMHASNHGPSHAQAQQDSPTPTSDPELLDPAEFRLQVEFFRKLGYSQREVRAALRKLGLAADTNTVLGELIRNQTAADRDSPPGAPQGGLMLVPRGGTSGRAPGSLPGTPPPPPGEEEQEDDEALKPIVIDGSNVAMSHGNKEVFSCQGIQLAVNYFLERGHKDITVFVPSWRKEQPRPDVPITDQHILRELEKKKIVVFTPSRRVGGKRVVCYDDRFIVKLAHETGGIIVSNDTYRDLQSVRPEWKRCVEEQLLMYSFVNDKFMPPDDPLGRHGPSLENFLRKKPLVPEHKRQPCPYGKKCTYGIKCKFYHQDRAHQSQRSLADELRANAKLSTLKEDNKRAVSPKKMTHTHADLAQGPASLSLEQDLELRLSLDHRGAPKGGHISISENVVLHRGSHPHPHSSRRSTSKKAAANHEWACHERANHNSPPSMDSKPGFHYGSQEPLDSGLGSYESQYSEASRGHGDPHCSPLGGPSSSSSSGSFHRYGLSAHQERQDGHQPCSCCSHQAPAPPPSCLQHYAQGPAPCQPCYTPFGGPLYTSAHLSHPYSLPGGCTFPSQVHHMGQQKYWSDPFHAVPQSRSASSLPTTQDQSLVGPFGDHHHQQATWVTMAPPAPPRQAAPYEAEREEVRKKLQAIFHPYQVDKVMGMLPHVLDPQALAAEILNLRSQGGML